MRCGFSNAGRMKLRCVRTTLQPTLIFFFYSTCVAARIVAHLNFGQSGVYVFICYVDQTCIRVCRRLAVFPPWFLNGLPHTLHLHQPSKQRTPVELFWHAKRSEASQDVSVGVDPRFFLLACAPRKKTPRNASHLSLFLLLCSPPRPSPFFRPSLCTWGSAGYGLCTPFFSSTAVPMI